MTHVRFRVARMSAGEEKELEGRRVYCSSMGYYEILEGEAWSQIGFTDLCALLSPPADGEV